jgi:glycosyltransferase involved in cell wall biosynthesis
VAYPARAPLASCILPTHERRVFLDQAVGYFLRQDYPHRELIVVDDGPDPVADLLPEADNIRYLRVARRLSLGAKRNLACAAAAGPVILHWDDDDWMAPWRIRYQVRQLLEQRADACGLREVVHLDPIGRRAWRYVYPGQARAWVAGGTLCYARALWRRNPFDDVDVGEDNGFLWSGRPRRVVALADCGFYVAVLHPGNTSPKLTGGRWWHPLELDQVLATLGDDRQFYADLPARLAGWT